MGKRPVPPPPRFRDPRWVCQYCGRVNGATDLKCRGCQSDRPFEIATHDTARPALLPLGSSKPKPKPKLLPYNPGAKK